VSNSAICNALARQQDTLTIYLDAIDALVSGRVQEYRLDTGQTVQNVTRLDLDKLQIEVDRILNRIATLEARCNGGGVVIARPSW
jgi:hypothetical protein